MIRLRPDPQSLRDTETLVTTLRNLPLLLTRSDEDEIQGAILRGLAQNFVLQRAGNRGSWRPLAPRTQADRLRRGYPPSRPILKRTGDYRDSVIVAGHGDHYSQAWRSSSAFALEEGSESRLDVFHEGGTRIMPARPATEMDADGEAHLGRTIDAVLARLFARWGL